MSRLSELNEALKELRNCGNALVGVSEALTELFSGEWGNYIPCDEKAADAPVTAPEKAPEKQEPTDEKKQEPKTEGPPKIAFEDIQKLASQKAHESFESKAKVKALLTNYGVKHLSDLKEEKYAEFMKDLEAV